MLTILQNASLQTRKKIWRKGEKQPDIVCESKF